MKINITITRSSEWVQARRLERGDNVPAELPVEVEVSDLSEDARRRLLSLNGKYEPLVERLVYRINYSPLALTSSWGSGWDPFLHDGDSATAAELSAAICAAFERLEAKREKHLAEKAEHEAQQAALAAEREAAARKLAEARELLAGKLMADKQQIESLTADRQTLAEFLAEVPADALRGTLKAVASSPERIDELRQAVEDASPIVIFASDEDDDD